MKILGQYSLKRENAKGEIYLTYYLVVKSVFKSEQGDIEYITLEKTDEKGLKSIQDVLGAKYEREFSDFTVSNRDAMNKNRTGKPKVSGVIL